MNAAVRRIAIDIIDQAAPMVKPVVVLKHRQGKGIAHGRIVPPPTIKQEDLERAILQVCGPNILEYRVYDLAPKETDETDNEAADGA